MIRKLGLQGMSPLFFETGLLAARPIYFLGLPLVSARLQATPGRRPHTASLPPTSQCMNVRPDTIGALETMPALTGMFNLFRTQIVR
jgi:hypothetical protein